MPYDKTVWKKGDKITPAKMNKLEKAVEELYQKLEDVTKEETAPKKVATLNKEEKED